MAESDHAFNGSIPQAYDTLMVPMLFDAYAGQTASLVASGRRDSVSASPA